MSKAKCPKCKKRMDRLVSTKKKLFICFDCKEIYEELHKQSEAIDDDKP